MNAFTPLSTDEVKLASKKLKNNKSPGPDGVPNGVIQMVGAIGPELITNLFNKFIENGMFPEILKLQKLVLFKREINPK